MRNNWNGNAFTELTIRRHRKLELVKAIQEKERNGWECIAPIAKTSNHKKEWQLSFSPKRANKKHEYSGVVEAYTYVVKMRRIAN
ncbi:hypothetical protein [Cytobacillus sp. IB215665]|uniref:hypothetical protein n=1 Tax=Cytobacillus sp. IB215665 TaxID=3097357 RepID=UPI002A13B996|nr:hypothetical protein [Cytobacillus sp. IB215665]MDX8367889.1 hypothetical protein [Cytobacillus sp. IB215665]